MSPSESFLSSKDVPVSCANPCQRKWIIRFARLQQFESISKRQKKFTRMVNQEKLRPFINALKLKNGYEIP